MGDDRERRVAERWFRRRGLPAIVRGRPAHLLVRIVPALAFLIVLDLLMDLASLADGQSDEEFDRSMQNWLFAVGYILLLVGIVVLPVLGAWLAARWARDRVVDRSGRPVALALTAVFVVGMPVVQHLLTGDDDGLLGLLIRALIVAVLLGMAFLGGGSILGWAIRAALRQTRSLRALAGRALPLLMLFNVFGFLTNEIWQMAAALPRYQMWLVVGLFALVAMLFLFARVPEELRGIIEARADRAARLHDTPFAACAVPGAHLPLRRLERLNLLLVLVLTQAMQAVVVATLMFVFFLTFGLISVRRPLMKTWSGQALTSGRLFGVQVPIPNELLHVCLFIAAFSGLYFVVNLATDTLYRSAFFDPLADHMAVSLSARDAYLTSLADRRDPSAPPN